MRLFHYLEHLFFLDSLYLHPIYTHIPQYALITLFLSISGYNRMAPLLTIGGRIAKGFDFLGYSFEPKGLSIAPKTLANFLERKTQLYEQGADVRRIGQYVRNWWRRVRAGVELGVSKLNADSFFCLPSMSILTLL